MTYSIVARDPVTGAMGAGVQSCMFGVGTVVPWARPGVGVVATQAITEPAYGPRCLDAIAAGAPAAVALEEAKAADSAAFVRQVGVVAADGTASAFTGQGCIDYAGDVVGDGFAVQANMMASADVCPAMAEAFTSATGPLARRLFAALCAGQQAGGDARGVMSAAIVVVAERSDTAWDGRLVDVRVDRSGDPLGELRGLLDSADAFAYFGQGVDLLFSGDVDAALAAVDAGLALLPGDENLTFLRAGALLAGGQADAGGRLLRQLVTRRPSWRVVVRSLAAKGFLAAPTGTSVDDLIAADLHPANC